MTAQLTMEQPYTRIFLSILSCCIRPPPTHSLFNPRLLISASTLSYMSAEGILKQKHYHHALGFSNTKNQLCILAYCTNQAQGLYWGDIYDIGLLGCSSMDWVQGSRPVQNDQGLTIPSLLHRHSLGSSHNLPPPQTSGEAKGTFLAPCSLVSWSRLQTLHPKKFNRHQCDLSTIMWTLNLSIKYLISKKL